MNEMDFFEENCKIINDYAACMDDYPYIYDIRRDRYFISEKATKRFRMKENLFSNTAEVFPEFIAEEDLPMLMEDFGEVAAGIKDSHSIRYHWMGWDNRPIWIHCRGDLKRDEQGNPAYIIGCVNEIGKRQLADNVTGLRQTVDIRKELDAGEYPAGFFLRIGIDGFKNVVDRLGMDYGDSMLFGVANCIAKCLAPGERVFRAVSDEFLVVNFNGGTVDDAIRLYRRIRVATDFFIEENQYRSVFTLSAGTICTDELEEESYAEVLRITQFTLNMAKKCGRNQIYRFNRSEYLEELRSRDLMTALRQAVANDFEGFELYFQPIMYSGQEVLYAAESLCRFFQNGKMISPAEFIPILEETGLIIPVGRWIMDQAAAQCKRCRRLNPQFRINVNLSYVQILKSRVTDDLLAALNRYDLDPDAFVIELTESGYLESTASVERVWNRMRNLGFRIAIDDFGSGYSNMRYLDRLRPNVLKIDRAFTLEALSREYAHHLLVNIIRMAHSMNLTVCIEGVETGEELVAVQDIEPDYIQGFYYGKPCTGEYFLTHYFQQAI